MDGHSTHYCPDTILSAVKEKVIIFTLPSNTTHLSQPLDKGCFGPLKAHWRHVWHDFLTKKSWKGGNTVCILRAICKSMDGIYDYA